jgi:hypothetical protein
MKLNQHTPAPFTDEEIRNLALDFSNDVCVAIDVRDLPNVNGITVLPMFVPSTISPKLHNLMLAAPHMYRGLAYNWQAFEDMRTLLDELNVVFERTLGDKIAGIAILEQTMCEIQDLTMAFMRAATEGPEKVAKELANSIDM